MAASPFALSSLGLKHLKPEYNTTRLTTVPPIGVRPGRLVIVGSGIKSIGQFTLEAVSEIKHADKVFYGVADPATEAFILENNPNAVDLYCLYDDSKPRIDTYVQMAEVILREVRKGYFVVGVFYGHPGVFVNPSHRAIAIAKSEGFDAIMYAGVSAEDCLFAEIGVDPSNPGCQIIEATDLLLRNRRLLTDSHVIIYQVGCIGLMDFNFEGMKNTHFPVLVERLVKDYGEDHPLISFRDSQVRFVPSETRRFLVKDLWDPEAQKSINGLTTFYLPPKEVCTVDLVMCERLGVKLPPSTPKTPNISGPFPLDEPYHPKALTAIESIDTHQLPENYRKQRATPHMYDALKRLALDPHARALYAQDKSSFVSPQMNLRAGERQALLSGIAYTTNLSMKASPATVADEFVERLMRDSTLAKQWSTGLRMAPKESPMAFNSYIQEWLFKRNMDVRSDDVKEAWARKKLQPMTFFADFYNTQIDGADGPTLVISAGTVFWGKTAIESFTFESNKLSWTQSNTNPNTAEFEFVMLTDDNGRPLPQGTYVGPYFSGFVTTNGTTSQVVGRVGDLPRNAYIHPTEGTKLSQYSSTYTTYTRNDLQDWVQSDVQLVVTDFSTVIYNGDVLKDYAWSNNSTLAAWTKDGNDWNISIQFYTIHGSTKDHGPGARFYGRRWAAGDSPPPYTNFMGTIGDASNPEHESDLAFWRIKSIASTMNRANAIAGALVLSKTSELAEKVVAWRDDPTPETHKEMENAEQDWDDAVRAQVDIELQEVAENRSGSPTALDPDLLPENTQVVPFIIVMFLCW